MAEEKTLIERLQDPEIKTINMHELAQEMKRRFEQKDAKGVREIFEAYLQCNIKNYPEKTVGQNRDIVRYNLMTAAILVDIGVENTSFCGEMVTIVKSAYGHPKEYREVARFCSKAIGEENKL